MFEKKTVESVSKLTFCYSVYDKAAEVYNAPMFFETEAVAIRAFKATVRPGTLLFDYPDDYSLVYLGQFDFRNGLFLDNEKKVVAEAKTYKETIENEIQRSGESEESGED